ncbi:HNH endonuclease signature motif containing protein [Gryllotalpicola koreensis]|uniref:HNH nuclease domain-containing protein n=1 Tax=Gryllotalpicola koreensis TaxID=993086 RepID=A0ABP8ACM9_9MICO
MAEAEQEGCAAFARLTAILPTSPQLLTDDQLVEYAGVVEAAGRFLDGLRLGVAREFDRRSDETLGEDSLARKLGARKPWGALETVTRTSAGEARARVIEASNLAKLPVFEQAVADGVLGRAQAEVICAPILKAVSVADPVAVEIACTELVNLSAALPASAVAEAARVWAAVLDPDGIQPQEKAAVEKRFLTLGRARNGLVKLTGLLPVEQAAAIRAVLDAYVNPRAGSSVAFSPTGPAADGIDPDGSKPALTATLEEPPVDSRSAKQKRADVLHAVFAAAARAPETPTMGGAHPSILVTVPKDVLESGRGAAWIDGEADPISSTAAQRIADSGGYQEVELSPTGEVLNLGRTERCFTPAQRRALAARDKGCVIPNCDVPARWTEAHHLKAWRDGGPTDVINAALLCWWHHFIIDDGPYQLRMGDDGVPEVRWVFGSHASPWVKAVHRPAPELTRAA